MMTNATFGDNTHIAPINRDTSDLGLFTIWQNLAKKHEKFGHPEKFISSIDKTKWMSFIEVNPSRYDIRYLVENFKKLSGIKGIITEKDLPKINPFKIKEQTAGLLKQLNDIPPYYVMYPGKDKSVALKESVLHPEYPKAKE